MSDQEAQAEAVRRWGRRGRAWRDQMTYLFSDKGPCQVGVKRPGSRRVGQASWRPLGWGATWEAAFDEAEVYLAAHPGEKP